LPRKGYSLSCLPAPVIGSGVNTPPHPFGPGLSVGLRNKGFIFPLCCPVHRDSQLAVGLDSRFPASFPFARIFLHGNPGAALFFPACAQVTKPFPYPHNYPATEALKMGNLAGVRAAEFEHNQMQIVKKVSCRKGIDLAADKQHLADSQERSRFFSRITPSTTSGELVATSATDRPYRARSTRAFSSAEAASASLGEAPSAISFFTFASISAVALSTVVSITCYIRCANCPYRSRQVHFPVSSLPRNGFFTEIAL
jgi:hypothetical protein